MSTLVHREMNQARCPFCQGTAKGALDVVDENRRATDKSFTYFRCTACASLFLPGFPTDFNFYYKDDYYEIPSLAKLQKIAARDRHRITLIERLHIGGSRLLEIGPAYGVFALQAKTAGFSVTAIEADGRCCEYLRSVVGIEAVKSDSPHTAIRRLPPQDVIAIWHALEHLPDPVAFLNAACENLAPGGTLAIAVPNPEAWQFKVMGRHWPHLDAPRHVGLISARALTALVLEMGLSELYRSSTDAEALHWNQFGWQYLLVNRRKTRMPRRLACVLGFLLAYALRPFERRKFMGSSYTLVFYKNHGS